MKGDIMKAIIKDGTVTIIEKEREVLFIEAFEDESHEGVHLFLQPLGNCEICDTADDSTPWTHELLGD
jgi:hypothetical protein